MDSIAEAFDDTWEFIQRHQWIEAATILVTFYIASRVSDWIITNVLRRLARRSDTDFDDRLIGLLHRPVKITIVMAGVIVAAYRLELVKDAERAIVLAAGTIIIIVWMLFGRRFANLTLSTMGDHPERFKYVHQTTLPLLSNAAGVVFFVIAVYAIFLVWDIDITGLVASAGIIGLALSFAAQDTLGNLFAGIAILSDRPYSIGDFIILDSGERGEVTRIGLRSTSLLTRDDVEVSIPNGIMGASKIVNEAGGPPGRFRIRAGLSVAYDSDLDQVVGIMMDTATGHAEILEHPAPRVRLRAFSDSGIDYELLAWIRRPADRGRVLHEIYSTLHRRFGEAGVKIPFPQREIHVRSFSGRDPLDRADPPGAD